MSHLIKTASSMARFLRQAQAITSIQLADLQDIAGPIMGFNPNDRSWSSTAEQNIANWAIECATTLANNGTDYPASVNVTLTFNPGNAVFSSNLPGLAEKFTQMFKRQIDNAIGSKALPPENNKVWNLITGLQIG